MLISFHNKEQDSYEIYFLKSFLEAQLILKINRDWKIDFYLKKSQKT